ncbi:MAG: Occludin/ELL family protein [Cyanobacteriota bacterium]
MSSLVWAPPNPDGIEAMAAWNRYCRRQAAGLIPASPALLFAATLGAAPVLAGPILCNTTLEAPLSGGGAVAGAAAVATGPVEVTRCGPVLTTSDLVQRRFYSYTAPFARGVDITHQITDFFGIAMGGGDGTKVMGFGFPDQTIIWDGSAIENTANAMLEEMSDPTPLRTADLPSSYTTSLGAGFQASGSGGAGAYASPTAMVSSWQAPIRGLW